MLVLTRRRSESLIIDNDIEITVLEINGNQVRLGCSAPQEVEIHRKEVWLRIQEEKERG